MFGLMVADNMFTGVLINSVNENKSYNNCIDQGVANMCLFDSENF